MQSFTSRSTSSTFFPNFSSNQSSQSLGSATTRLVPTFIIRRFSGILITSPILRLFRRPRLLAGSETEKMGKLRRNFDETLVNRRFFHFKPEMHFLDSALTSMLSLSLYPFLYFAFKGRRLEAHSGFRWVEPVFWRTLTHQFRFSIPI